MGIISIEKAELAAYTLKDVPQIAYTQWRDNSELRGDLVTWLIFKKDFLDNFFPRELREAKVKEFTCDTSKIT